MGPYLDIDELALVLQCKTRTIRRLLNAQRGLVPPPVRGPYLKMLRWRAADVQCWLQQQEKMGEIAKKPVKSVYK